MGGAGEAVRCQVYLQGKLGGILTVKNSLSGIYRVPGTQTLSVNFAKLPRKKPLNKKNKNKLTKNEKEEGHFQVFQLKAGYQLAL